MTAHDAEPYICWRCLAELWSWDALQEHMIDVHQHGRGTP